LTSSKQFDLELEAFEETKRMKYITTIGRQAEARGIELGSSRKARSLIQRQLTHRLGNLPTILLTKIDKLPLDQIDQLGEALLDFTSLQDLEQWLEQHQPEDPDRPL
jgi:heme oxygenase